MAELLLELFSEEIPARMQDRAREDLARGVADALAAADLTFDQPVRSFATPRRLAVVITGLPLQQADRVVERKGPRADASEQARAGFLRGLSGLDYTVEEREDKKARVVFALVREQGRAVSALLGEMLPAVIGRLPWPKSMRWGDGDFRWVRPLQSILCLFDGGVVHFDLGGIAASDRTRGHRFVAPDAFEVRDFADYVVKLRAARVVLDGVERRAIIARATDALAAGQGLAVVDDPALLDELKGLVEWPVPLMGAIDETFMTVPPEALVTTMRTNQKYLALRTGDGVLARQFVLVANMEASDGGTAIVAGNERVLRARLWDAKFFWDQDRKVLLESRLPALEYIVFHAQLGSLGERVERLVALSSALLPHLRGADPVLTKRAALLAKADLVTAMVGEFPELQGIMGAHYAELQGEHPDVSQAIREQYSPKGPDDTCPTSATSIVVAMADKFDTLVGFFSIDVKPSGSKDPYALRRAALGIVRLVLTNNLRLSLRRVVEAAQTILVQSHERKMRGDRAPPPLRYTPSGLSGRASGFVGHGPTSNMETLAGEVIPFLIDRLKVQLRERGIRHDVIGAVVAVAGGDDLVDLRARAEALQAFLATEDGRNLVGAFRRAGNIVAIEEKRDGRRYDGQPVASALVDQAEHALFAALENAEASIAAALAVEDYGAAMSALAALRGPVDGFFAAVMVNVAEPDLRLNRLLLLGRIRSSLAQVADFSLIEETGRPTA